MIYIDLSLLSCTFKIELLPGQFIIGCLFPTGFCTEPGPGNNSDPDQQHCSHCNVSPLDYFDGYVHVCFLLIYSLKKWLSRCQFFFSQQSFQKVVIGINQRHIDFGVQRFGACAVQQ